ncbi:MAG: hypothetical protein M3N04_08710 [Actinomycetota bacterium]|nr:hypothetical protein [Actinomycetota bacterium]
MKPPSNKTHNPGPGKSTSKAAFDELTKQIAARNEQAHKAAKKLRDAKESKTLAEKRRRDLA